MICKDGHANQAGGCCCPVHGNTCGFHPEYSGRDESVPLMKSAFVPKDAALPVHSLKELAESSPAWAARLKLK